MLPGDGLPTEIGSLGFGKKGPGERSGQCRRFPSMEGACPIVSDTPVALLPVVPRPTQCRSALKLEPTPFSSEAIRARGPPIPGRSKPAHQLSSQLEILPPPYHVYLVSNGRGKFFSPADCEDPCQTEDLLRRALSWRVIMDRVKWVKFMPV